MTKEEFKAKLDSGYLVGLEYAPPSAGEVHEAWVAARETVEQEFKRDLLEVYGATDHPQAELVFKLAYDKGVSGGYRAIATNFDEFAVLLGR